MPPHLRVARPTTDLDRLVDMYSKGLGLEILGRFNDHEGFDGVILGEPSAAYHLEFTVLHGDGVCAAPTKDHLLVFYVPDAEAWRNGCDRMVNAGFRRVRSFNPYWDRNGATFEDPDGYRVVLQNASWNP